MLEELYVHIYIDNIREPNERQKKEKGNTNNPWTSIFFRFAPLLTFLVPQFILFPFFQFFNFAF